MKNLFLSNPARGLAFMALLLVVSLLAVPAYGQTGGPLGGNVAPPAPTTNVTNINSVFVLINQVFDILFWLLIVLATIFIIWAAFSYLTAGGDPEKVKTAGHRVIYAAVAVVVAVLAKAIPTIVCNFIATDGCSANFNGAQVGG